MKLRGEGARMVAFDGEVAEANLRSRRRTVPRGWIPALGLLVLIFTPGESAAQERCPVIMHRTPPAQRDSLLQSLEAEEIALTGFVRDEVTGAPVPDITVFVDGTRHGTMTAEDGSYLIERVNQIDGLPGRPMIEACAIGWEYLTETREVRLTPPWDGTVVLMDGRTMPNPGYAVRLDFRVRRRPNVF